MVGSEDDLILDCYRLAAHYHVSPDVFLSMPLTDMELHRARTAQIIRAQQPIDDDE